MGLAIPNGINARALIDDATVLGFCVLSDEQEKSIFTAQREIEQAQEQVREADSKINDADKKSKDAEAKGNDAEDKISESESKKDSAPTEENGREKTSDAQQMSSRQKAAATQANQQNASTDAKIQASQSRAQSVGGQVDANKAKITDLAAQNRQIAEENQALLDGMQSDVAASFDGTGSGLSSAYSLSTATEAQEIRQKQPEDASLKASSNPNSAKFDANVDKMSANEAQIQQTQSEADAQGAQAQAQASQEEAEAQQVQQAGEQVKANGESEKGVADTLLTLGGNFTQVGNALDVSGSVLKAVGAGLTAAGTATTAAGGATTATGAVVTGIGAGVTALGVPLTALFGIGIPIVGAGGTTTAGGGTTTAAGVSVTGAGTGIVSAGATTTQVGTVLGTAGKGLKVAGGTLTTTAKVAQGDIQGAITSGIGLVATGAAFGKATGIGSKAVMQKVYDVASTSKDAIGAVKHFSKGEYAEGFANAFSAAAYGSDIVGDFAKSDGIKSAANIADSAFSTLSSTSAAYSDFSEGKTADGIFDVAAVLVAGGKTGDKATGLKSDIKADDLYKTIGKAQKVYDKFLAPDAPRTSATPEIAQNYNQQKDQNGVYIAQNNLNADSEIDTSLICQNDAINTQQATPEIEAQRRIRQTGYNA